LAKVSFKEINRLAVPAIIAGIAEPLISITDIAIIGNVKENPVEALAAAGLAGSFLSAIIWIVAQTKTAISALVSQHYGAKRLHAVRTLVPQAILFNFLFSIVIYTSTAFFAEVIFKAYNADGLILEYTSGYYKIRALGYPLTLVTFALFGVFRGIQNTLWAMKCSLTGATVNVLLTYIFVYGIEGYVPAMHLTGAAWASVIAQAVMFVMAFRFFLLKNRIPPKNKQRSESEYEGTYHYECKPFCTYRCAKFCHLPGQCLCYRLWKKLHRRPKYSYEHMVVLFLFC
jgi:MATE family multidrug resistance protein